MLVAVLICEEKREISEQEEKRFSQIVVLPPGKSKINWGVEKTKYRHNIGERWSILFHNAVSKTEIDPFEYLLQTIKTS